MGRPLSTTTSRNHANKSQWSFIKSFLSRSFGNKAPSSELGDIWNSDTAAQAFEQSRLRSRSAGGSSSLKLVFRNATPLPLVLCWISEQSHPHNFYTLEPLSKIPSKFDDVIGPQDKLECSYTNHAFTISLPKEASDKENSENQELHSSDIVAGYRPTFSSETFNEENPVHFVTITRKRKRGTFLRRGCFGVDNDDLHRYSYKINVREGKISEKSSHDTVGAKSESRSSSVLGDVWDSSTAADAYSTGTLRSAPNRGLVSPVRLAFRNTTPTPLTLCWINKDGTPHHFRPLKPNISSHNAKLVTENDKIERSFTHDAFTISLPDENESANTSGHKSRSTSSSDKGKLLDTKSIIGGYRASCVSLRESGDEDDDDSDANNETGFHLITISRKKSGSSFQYRLVVREAGCDPDPIDSSQKHYEDSELGGWPVRLEADWSGGDKKLERRLEADLKAASDCLPTHARELLKRKHPTLLWVNKSLKYGPKSCPIRGQDMCFHPGDEWLKKNGMHPSKKGCIELYEACKYMDDCNHWGPGGLLLHELSHAFHFKCLPDGYNNKEIQDCYKKAMEEKLYENVRVHGSQGPTAKAYACTNCMEYFAELSVAFLGGLSPNEEHNKWFPFNRKQLQQHDPRAYKLLGRLWNDVSQSK